MEIPRPSETQEKTAAVGATLIFVLGLLALVGGVCELSADPLVGSILMGLGFLGVCGAFVAAGEELRR